MKTAISIALIGLAATVSTGAAAQDMGGYVGASVGQAKAKSFCDGFVGSGCDDKDTAWKVFGGYNFHRHFGVELGYTDLGDATATVGATTFKFETKGIELTAVGIWPINERFSLFGKAGVYRWDLDVSATAGLVDIDENGTNFTYGFGLHYYFRPNIAIRAEWQKYKHVGESSTTGRSDLNMISAGVVFRF
jgi:OOP family OmpA-OmpF porin